MANNYKRSPGRKNGRSRKQCKTKTRKNRLDHGSECSLFSFLGASTRAKTGLANETFSSEDEIFLDSHCHNGNIFYIITVTLLIEIINQLAVFDEYTCHRLPFATHYRYTLFKEAATANQLISYDYFLFPSGIYRRTPEKCHDLNCIWYFISTGSYVMKVRK